MAGEQSTGTFIRVPGETDELRAQSRRTSRKYSTNWTRFRRHLCREPERRRANAIYRRAEVSLSWPLSNMGPSLPNLLATVAGNLFELKPFSGLKLLDVTLPPEFLNRYQGPQFGVAGTRKLSKVYDRPLIGTIIKAQCRTFARSNGTIGGYACERRNRLHQGR